MTIFTDIISNVALLLALSVLYSYLTRIWKQEEQGIPYSVGAVVFL